MLTEFFIVGPDISEADIQTKRGASPAAAAWMQALIRLLEGLGTVSGSIWYDARPSWPADVIAVPRHTEHVPSRSKELVSYLNLPLIKRASTARSIELRLATKSLQNLHVIVYGANSLPVSALKRLNQKCRLLTVVIADTSSNHRVTERLQEIEGCLSGGILYLPASLRNILTSQRSLFFPGIVTPRARKAKSTQDPKRKFVFVGGVDKYSGSHFLVDALKQCNLKDVDVVVAGRVADKKAALEMQNLGVRVTGFLSEEELAAECSSAFAFLNPRDPQLTASATNFPSKLLLYLAYNAPIVSTMTDGMPDFLVECLDCKSINSPKEFARRIELYTIWPLEMVEQLTDRISSVVSGRLSYAHGLVELERFFEARAKGIDKS